MFNLYFAVNSQTNIFYHLTGTHLYSQDTFNFLRQACNFFLRARIKGNRAKDTYFNSFFTS